MNLSIIIYCYINQIGVPEIRLMKLPEFNRYDFCILINYAALTGYRMNVENKNFAHADCISFIISILCLYHVKLILNKKAKKKLFFIINYKLCFMHLTSVLRVGRTLYYDHCIHFCYYNNNFLLFNSGIVFLLLFCHGILNWFTSAQHNSL